MPKPRCRSIVGGGALEAAALAQTAEDAAFAQMMREAERVEPPPPGGQSLGLQRADRRRWLRSICAGPRRGEEADEPRRDRAADRPDGSRAARADRQASRGSCRHTFGEASGMMSMCAIQPALPSQGRPGWSPGSTMVTAHVRASRSACALARPTMPAPMTAMRASGGPPQRSTTWKPWANGSLSSMTIVLKPVTRAQPSMDGMMASWLPTCGAPFDAARERRADDALVHEHSPSFGRSSPGGELRHAGGGAGAAGRAVDRLVAVEDGVAGRSARLCALARSRAHASGGRWPGSPGCAIA